MPDPIQSGPYDTPIPAEQKSNYLRWLGQQPPQAQNAYDYDIQGAYLAGAGSNQRGHYPDQFKKPNHPTFSNQSQYAPMSGQQAGQWANQDGRDYFLAAPSNLKYQTLPQLQDYFGRVEPNATLVPPPAGSAQLGLPGVPPAPLPYALQKR